MMPTSYNSSAIAKVIVLYFASWSIYRRNAEISEMQLSNATHLIYAFGTIGADYKFALDDTLAATNEIEQKSDGTYQSTSPQDGNLYGQLGELFQVKLKYRQLKTGISIGGSSSSSKFANMVSTSERRQIFIASLCVAMKNYGVDFVDIDWEFQVAGQYSSVLGSKYLMFITELKAALQNLPWRAFVTVAFPVTACSYSDFDVVKISGLVEFINLMCYDYNSDSPQKTNHLAPLNGADSVSSSVNLCLKRGIPSNKLVMGIPAYGKSYSGTITMGKTSPSIVPGPGMYEAGFMDHSEIIGLQPTLIQLYDTTANYGYSIDKKKMYLISHETKTSIDKKKQFGASNGIKGYMLWHAGCDCWDTFDQSLYSQFSNISPLDYSTNNIQYPSSTFTNVRRHRLLDVLDY